MKDETAKAAEREEELELIEWKLVLEKNLNKSGYAKSSLIINVLALKRLDGVLKDGVSLSRFVAS